MPVLGRGYLPDWVDEDALGRTNCMVYDEVGRVCCELPYVPAPEGCIRAGIPAYPSWPPKPDIYGPERGIWEPHAPEHGKPVHRFVEMTSVRDQPHPHLFHGVDDLGKDAPAPPLATWIAVGGALGALVGYAMEVVPGEKLKTAALGAGIFATAGALLGVSFQGGLA